MPVGLHVARRYAGLADTELYNAIADESGWIADEVEGSTGEKWFDQRAGTESQIRPGCRQCLRRSQCIRSR